jgi:hypothetical protein
MQSSRIMLVIAVSCILLAHPSHFVFADHDDHKDDVKWYQKIFGHNDNDDGKHESEYLKPVDNEAYEQECGTCHFAYQPGLLPSGSWDKILAGLSSHFGEEISLTQELKKDIARYLKTNAAEYSSAKRAKKILKSLHGQTPIRITDTPYIQEKHHELVSRKSATSYSNCLVCHPTAEQGIYEDD